MKSRTVVILVSVMLLCALYAIFLHSTQEPLFMYREQQQIFLWDADYLAGLLRQTGGFSTLASQFLVQFFHLPWAGA
ncbi:MAG: hypothetical protein ILA03_01875, partial [Bacteroidaceae bacterium]|nr:hypothetical protein [Bacteroidaceae bacterium]